jgi:hypothetical protein
MMEKMQNGMMKHYKMFATIGIIIVLIAFWQSTVGASANATFFSVDKAAREAASAGSALAAANVTRHLVPTWVPHFKFLGLGILLCSITMALGVIVTTLRNLGTNVMSKWPTSLIPGTPEKPRTAKMFPMLMMMGWVLLIASLVWALGLNGTIASYWNHSVASELNPAQPGSTLLTQLATITASLPWINLVKFTGMSALFTSITVVLTVIIRTLQHQEKALLNFIQTRTASGD